jgi:hypothetical protein
VKDYRPADLASELLHQCKICTKGMTLWLQPVFQYLLHSDQTGFLKGRCIAKNFVYATEIVQACLKHCAKAIVLNLDFRKAFGYVHWGALH